jgi:hypothetical protein
MAARSLSLGVAVLPAGGVPVGVAGAVLVGVDVAVGVPSGSSSPL